MNTRNWNKLLVGTAILALFAVFEKRPGRLPNSDAREPREVAGLVPVTPR